MSASLTKLTSLGQSLWLDNIERSLLKSGELAELVKRWKLSGITSNPSIFEKAISSSDAYDESIEALISQGVTSAEDIIDALMVEDIVEACDLLRPIYDKTQGTDGMVSIEVSPDLAHDTDGTVKHALALHKAINRDNVMIKVPATLAGLPAITQLIAAGISVNVTLLFSVARYQKVVDAYLTGLEQRLSNGHGIDKIRSVASFFISRVDAAIDPKLASIDPQHPLLGKSALGNAHAALTALHQAEASDRFATIKAQGGHMQRLLWASTSTKNPEYSDVLYVENMIQENTVNTVPPATIEAFEDHGQPEQTMSHQKPQYEQVLDQLQSAGIDLSNVLETLEQQGVAAFQQAFVQLKAVISKRSKGLQSLSA